MAKRNIGLLIRLINTEYTKLMDAKVSQFGVSASQAEALYNIFLDEGLSQSQLKSRLGISAASLSVLIDSLENKKYAQRRADPDDPRRTKLYLTTSAREFAEEIVAIKRSVYTGITKSMSEAQLALLAEWLEEFLDNLMAQSVPGVEKKA